MAKWLAKEFDWDTGRYTGRYYDIAEAGIVAVFVDSFYGDDASADPEDPDLPLKTLGAAITYLNTNGAHGSRIFMNGIFSENLPAQTYWYEFIGCGGGRNGRTVLEKNISLNIKVVFQRHLTRVHNIDLVNYNDDNIATNNTSNHTIYFLNSKINNARMTGVYQIRLFFYYCICIDFKVYHSAGGATHSAGGNENIFINFFYNGVGNISFAGMSNSYFLNCTQNGTSALGNIVDVVAQFINTSNNDYNVRITSPLLGGGLVDEITGIAANVGGVEVGLPYNGITPEFTTEGGATITDLTIDANGKFTITAPATTGTLETALMDLGNIYPLENIDLFNVFDFLSGEITQGVFETFSSPRMALTIKLKYGLTSAEVDDCPWLLIEYGKQPTFSGTDASRVGNADDIFDPDTFQTITCRYMKLFITLQNNS